MQRLFLQIVASFVLLFIAIQTLGAQSPNLQLTLRYNPFLTRYEVYALPDANQPTFNWGPAQISVVAPASIPDAPFNVTSVAGGAWLDNSLIFAPAAAPGSDFHGIGSLGAPTTFTANVEKLIFHFTLPGGGCTEGLRLFINGVDPNSMAAGMGGGDFTNTIFAIVPGFPLGYEAYTGNYNNAGSSCNAPPVAVSDPVTTTEDGAITFNPLTNDTDPNNNINPASVMVVAASPNGVAGINPVTGEITFTPNANFNGTTTFTYSVCDLGTPVYCDTATVTVTVTAVNDAPVANNDTQTTPEDAPVTINVLANDTDVDGTLVPGTIDLDPATPGVQTTFTVAGQGTFTVDPVTGVVTFTPVANFTGTTTPVTYQVCDNGTPLPAQCDDATITVTVTAVNDAPVANNDTQTTPEDAPVTINVLANDTDVDGTLVPGTIDLDPATPGVQTTFTVAGQGTFTVDPVTGVVTFTPVANFTGTTTPVTYQVCDNGTPLPAQCDDATITVTVTAVNDAPVANNDTQTTPEDAPVTINILANDTDVDGTLVPGTIDLDPATPGVQTTFTVAGQGTFTVDPVTGVVTFTPVANFNGTTTPVTYQVCDNGTPLPAQCDDATITVTVTPANDVPTITQGPVTTNEDAPVVICPTVGDSDMGDVLTVSPCAVPANGTLVSGPGNCVTFTPNPNFNGTQTVCIQVCDQTGACATVNVPVTVNAVNDAPVVNNAEPEFQRHSDGLYSSM